MAKFIFGFISASILFISLLFIIDVPDYITYDCLRLNEYNDVPEHVIKACSNSLENNKKNYRLPGLLTTGLNSSEEAVTATFISGILSDTEEIIVSVKDADCIGGCGGGV